MMLFITMVLAFLTAMFIVSAIVFALMLNTKFWRWYTKKIMKVYETVLEDDC